MIELDRVERDFLVGDETVHALSEVSLTLPAGDYVSVMGPSGSGKSTLLNVLGLLDRPNSGSYLLDGVETTAEPRKNGLHCDAIISVSCSRPFTWSHGFPRPTISACPCCLPASSHGSGRRACTRYSSRST